MACCGRVTKNKKVIKPEALKSAPAESLEYVEILYLGETSLKVTGCYTKNKYWFSQDVKRKIVRQDAECLFDNLPGMFVEDVSIEISSDNSATELELESSESEVD